MTTESAPSIQTYYDRFAPNYERERHHGYHRLIDELELGLIKQYATGRDVFEAGCGTGLLLREAAGVARRAVGLDLSRSMLAPAAGRGLQVVQGSVDAAPLPSGAFDLVYSMKVLPHVPDIRKALAELARLTRPGGHLLLEFYNPFSFRYLVKALGGPAKIAGGTTDRDVFTRYDTLDDARSYLPPDVDFVGSRGVRIFTPASSVFRWKALGSLFSRAEHAACDNAFWQKFAGFVIVIGRKRSSP